MAGWCFKRGLWRIRPKVRRVSGHNLTANTICITKLDDLQTARKETRAPSQCKCTLQVYSLCEHCITLAICTSPQFINILYVYIARILCMYPGNAALIGNSLDSKLSQCTDNRHILCHNYTVPSKTVIASGPFFTFDGISLNRSESLTEGEREHAFDNSFSRKKNIHFMALLFSLFT